MWVISHKAHLYSPDLLEVVIPHDPKSPPYITLLNCLVNEYPQVKKDALPRQDGLRTYRSLPGAQDKSQTSLWVRLITPKHSNKNYYCL
jgi:hypothetical protein